jgi:hypothetical protein
VPETERVGEATEREDGRPASGHGDQEAPARDVEQAHPAEEACKAPALTLVERVAQESTHRGHGWRLMLIATESQLCIQIDSRHVRLLLTMSSQGTPRYASRMDLDSLPPQVRSVLGVLSRAVNSREPAIRGTVEQLRISHPSYDNHQLALAFLRSTRRRVAATGALSGAVSIAPGLGTLLAVGTITSQTLYALEQEVELVLGIAMIFGHELSDSDDRVIEALVVVGITSGAVKLREDVLVAGGERIAIAAVRHLPTLLLTHGGGRVLTRILARFATSGAAKVAARVVPLGVGVAVGAGFDWIAVTGLGRAAMKYYGPGGPGARPLLLAPKDPSDIELGR